MIRLEMNSNNMILWASLSRNIDNYEYLTDKEILPSDQRGMREQAKLPLQQVLEKQIIPIEDQGKK